MTFEDENEVRSLIVGPARCRYRAALKQVYGYDIPIGCPYRKILKATFEGDQAKIETEKYLLEHPM